MLSSFAFIIPLNYQIKAKNKLSRRREQRGPDTFVWPVGRHGRFCNMTTRFFFPYFALFSRKYLIIAFLYDFPTLFTRKYSQNTRKKRKMVIKIHRSADFRFCIPPVQESIPDNVKGGRDHTNTAHPIRVQYS